MKPWLFVSLLDVGVIQLKAIFRIGSGTLIMLAALSSSPLIALSSPLTFDSPIAESFATALDCECVQVVIDKARLSMVIGLNTEIASRYYSGKSVGIETNATSSAAGEFTVKLYKGNSYVGSSTLKCNGVSRAEWSNIGPGTFRFILSKPPGSPSIICSSVRTYSW